MRTNHPRHPLSDNAILDLLERGVPALGQIVEYTGGPTVAFREWPPFSLLHGYPHDQVRKCLPRGIGRLLQDSDVPSRWAITKRERERVMKWGLDGQYGVDNSGIAAITEEALPDGPAEPFTNSAHEERIRRIRARRAWRADNYMPVDDGDADQ